MRLRPALAVALVLALFGLSACSGDDDGGDGGDSASDPTSAADTVPCEYPADPAGAAKEVDAPPTDAPSTGQVDVTIATSVGDLKATLDQEATPCTVNSFVSLAEQGYFDATQCHRMTLEGIFVLQCGDPTASGMGGPGYTFADELTGEETYPAGTLAMANGGPDTNGSQFFIVYADTQLDPDYAVFGSVDGASVKIVQKVAKKGVTPSPGGNPADGTPKKEVEIESVTVS
jgi:peptidyl-prolyl cis-trans isomerase B (cyclophilin B)